MCEQNTLPIKWKCVQAARSRGNGSPPRLPSGVQRGGGLKRTPPACTSGAAAVPGRRNNNRCYAGALRLRWGGERNTNGNHGDGVYLKSIRNDGGVVVRFVHTYECAEMRPIGKGQIFSLVVGFWSAVKQAVLYTRHYLQNGTYCSVPRVLVMTRREDTAEKN